MENTEVKRLADRLVFDEPFFLGLGWKSGHYDFVPIGRGRISNEGMQDLFTARHGEFDVTLRKAVYKGDTDYSLEINTFVEQRHLSGCSEARMLYKTLEQHLARG